MSTTMCAPRAIHVDEVGGLRLEIFHYRLDGRTEGAVLYQLISLLHRNAARDHEAHEPYFSFLPLVGPKRAVALHQRIGCHQSRLGANFGEFFFHALCWIRASRRAGTLQPLTAHQYDHLVLRAVL